MTQDLTSFTAPGSGVAGAGGGDARRDDALLAGLQAKLGPAAVGLQFTADQIPTWWVGREQLPAALQYLKREVDRPFTMLYDLTAIDERHRQRRIDQPTSDFTLVYHLLSCERNEDVRLKVALDADDCAVDSTTTHFAGADWYERELWDMFGVEVRQHPHLRRILMPETWAGHPLRKDHPARATELEPYELPDEQQEREEAALHFEPERWGLQRRHGETEFLFLNVGPQHPGTHGVLRVVLQLDGETIVDAVPEIGFHHRGAEKMAERQSWHTYIPYTDRVDYLAGVQNNLPYVMAVEKLAGIDVPARAQVIRVMMCELFRIISHLVWYGTFAQDVGQLSPTFYMFTDRERAFGVVEAICGARMHPNWFRIGGTAQDLPEGWEQLFRDFVPYMRKKLDEYDKVVLGNRIFKARTLGIGAFDTAAALEWGVTGPMLRATGFDWDLRRRRPYSGYEQFDFDIPIADAGDCYARALVRVEEMRQSLRIIEQCVEHMPAGSHKADHPLTTPPLKERTMKDIETLIGHFLGVSWGPVIPAGEAMVSTEAPKGMYGYYLVSDHDSHAYRCRIRTPSFPHLQLLPEMCRGLMVPDLLAILGSIDYVLADVDR
jgi:NADH-quinone oxidoreductase subunit C/D